MGKLPASHRYNRLPLPPSDSGGFQQELVAQDLPGAKVLKFSLPPNKNFNPCNFKLFSITNRTTELLQQFDFLLKNGTIHKKIDLYLSKLII